MFSRIIGIVEEMIDDGYPFTLPIAVAWTIIGWPLYIAERVLREIEQ